MKWFVKLRSVLLLERKTMIKQSYSQKARGISLKFDAIDKACSGDKKV